MVPITALWIPIVVAAVFVFIVSSIMHMALTYHRSDYRQLPHEGEVLDALRRAASPPETSTTSRTARRTRKWASPR